MTIACLLRTATLAGVIALATGLPCAGLAQNSEATLVWDISRQCFRPRSQPQGQCGVRWDVATRRYATPQQGGEAAADAAQPAAPGLADVLGTVESPGRNGNVQQLQGAAAALESVINATPQPTVPAPK